MVFGFHVGSPSRRDGTGPARIRLHPGDYRAPLHQTLGSDSLDLAQARVRMLRAEIESARPLAITTDIVES
ncbi:hypothetical protein B7C42_06996 [Nocardia cerradoensis]|uniref:Uncharacterized protein n=1 Tax=Nocardia cerradoensis TaxID=85688 RepID=A0A231GWI9_9NOCA|nr:hypothetical protein B7C42_06996 [Nocardia cerradoensis]